jgi:O-methyltransferase
MANALAHTYSVVSAERLTNLKGLARGVVNRKINGDVVECGVAAGGSAALLAWSVLGSNKHAWLYDSFEGLPEPSDVDGPKAPQFFGANRSSANSVRAAMEMAGVLDTRYTIVEGWFHDTFKQENAPESVALLHIDADWHDSVLLALRRWHDNVSQGGVIVLDDFGFWRGCRLAFYEFCAERQIAPDLQRNQEQGWWEKHE